VTSLKVILLIVTVFIIAYLARLSFITRHTVIKAESERILKPCRNSNNCVFSDSTEERFKIRAFNLLQGDKIISWDKLKTQEWQLRLSKALQ